MAKNRPLEEILLKQTVTLFSVLCTVIAVLLTGCASTSRSPIIEGVQVVYETKTPALLVDMIGVSHKTGRFDSFTFVFKNSGKDTCVVDLSHSYIQSVGKKLYPFYHKEYESYVLTKKHWGLGYKKYTAVPVSAGADALPFICELEIPAGETKEIQLYSAKQVYRIEVNNKELANDSDTYYKSLKSPVRIRLCIRCRDTTEYVTIKAAR